MKKGLVMVVAAVMFVVSVSVFAGCGGPPKVYEDGYFKYCIVKYNEKNTTYNDAYDYGTQEGEKVIAIVGLTESGQQQEVIDFPDTIAGKRVAYLGWGWKDGTYSCMAGRGEGFFFIESPKLKKFYVPMSVYAVNYGAFIDILDSKAILCGINLPKTNHSFSSSSTFYVCDKTKIKIGSGYSPSLTFDANIAFMNNYSDEVNGGYYRIDNVDIGETIPLPPAPVREGYRFTGWYTEPECKNRWDFDAAPFIDAEEEITRLSLYAGWEG